MTVLDSVRLLNLHDRVDDLARYMTALIPHIIEAKKMTDVVARLKDQMTATNDKLREHFAVQQELIDHRSATAPDALETLLTNLQVMTFQIDHQTQKAKKTLATGAVAPAPASEPQPEAHEPVAEAPQPAEPAADHAAPIHF